MEKCPREFSTRLFRRENLASSFLRACGLKQGLYDESEEQGYGGGKEKCLWQAMPHRLPATVNQ